MIITETPARRASPAERKRVSAWIRKWQREFYLDILRIDVLFHDYPREDDPREACCNADIDTDLADTYHRVTLQIYPPFFDVSAEDQEFSVVHELAHVLAHPLVELVEASRNGLAVSPQELRSANERVADRFAKIVMYGGNSGQSEKPIRVKKARRTRCN